MPTDTNVSNLIINVLDEQQYEQIQNPSRTELYLVPEVVDTVPTENSTNTVTSGGVYDAINNAKKVYWCYWDDDNNTVTGLTPEQIYQLTQDGCIVKCKMMNTSGDDYIFTLQRCTFSQSNYEIIFSQCADVNTRYVNSYTIRYENNAWAYIEAVYNVQADWNQSLPSEPDYIKNKPIIPTLRTMNHEQLIDSTLGDINIHDGYYFPNAVQDYDGNWYGAVVIGDQVWLGENLKTTHYADGTPIANGTGHTTDATAYYYYPNQQSSNKNEFGLLYNYNAVMHGSVSNNNIPSGVQGISPTGWHVPSLAEFEKMLMYVGNQKRYKSLDDSNLTVNKAISTDKNLWSVSSNVNGFPTCLPQLNNKTFFGAKPAGMAAGSNQYQFSEIAKFKTVTTIDNNYQSIAIQGATGQIDSYISVSGGGLYAESVRCVSDLTPVQFRNWYVEQYGSMQHNLSDTFDLTNFNNADWNYVFNL